MIIVRLLLQILVSFLLFLLNGEKPLKNIAMIIFGLFIFAHIFYGISLQLQYIAALGAIFSFFDFLMPKLARNWLKQALEDVTIRLILIQDRISKSEPSTRKMKISRVSFVERIGRYSAWRYLTKSIMISTGVILLYSSASSPNYLLVALLMLFAVLSAVEAGLIMWRTINGQYGLIGLEVKEIGRVIANQDVRTAMTQVFEILRLYSLRRRVLPTVSF